jgi:hypothetical protein
MYEKKFEAVWYTLYEFGNRTIAGYFKDIRRKVQTAGSTVTRVSECG